MIAFHRFGLAIVLGIALQCQAQDGPVSQNCPEPVAVPDDGARVSNQAPIETGRIEIYQHLRTSELACWLRQAYGAYKQGHFDQARRAYLQAHRLAPQAIEGLLGLAAVAVRQQQQDQARHWYRQVLTLDPSNVYALAGLASLPAGPAASSAESRLKTQLKRHPDEASLHFALGNLYARQGRWPEAQQAYFEAYRHHRSNPDYAYNLAVSLDRLGKFGLARRYYEQALELGQFQACGFSAGEVRDRLRDLARGES